MGAKIFNGRKLNERSGNRTLVTNAVVVERFEEIAEIGA